MFLILILLIFTIQSVVYTNTLNNLDQVNFPCQSNRPAKYDNLSDFAYDMCAQCFHYMDNRAFQKDYLSVNGKVYAYRPKIGQSKSGLRNRLNLNEPLKTVDYWSFNLTSPQDDPILKMFKNQFFRDIFIGCCRDAINCCNGVLSKLERPKDGRTYCQAKWDGWNCWPYALADTSLTDKCPDSAFQRHDELPPVCLRGEAVKRCLSNGSWLTIAGEEKTDYSGCTYTGQRNNLYRSHVRVGLHFVSLLASLLACGIYIFYKQYNILRIRLHLNFFTSFIFTSITQILFNLAVTDTHLDSHEDNIIIENKSWCIMLYVLYRTANLTNYGWMLCEGIYLHKMIVAAFREQKSMTPFYILGWILPLSAMVPYCIVNSLPKYNNKCWTQPMPIIAWIYSVVPLTALIGNLILLLNIIRVFFTKLTASPDHFRSALRATSILIIVFGVHYLFFLIEPTLLQSCDVIPKILLYIGLVSASLQGAITATLLCFCNSEVHLLIKRSLRRRFFNFKEEVTEEHDLGKKILMKEKQRLADDQINT
ncbi:calcitonin gene-related peptide type 1 receptor isoform X2 [Tetranychus urticae]|uniref:calcitonin gene-related peptide type 1 receptor isoform X2 n=1 Tax=Tetranychus urticae TaxID=32264 RepID=UPI00077B8E18|nr:calcitonin gene-related peptide type 1 receptor isoform X2 [Tetranychus urticae]